MLWRYGPRQITVDFSCLMYLFFYYLFCLIKSFFIMTLRLRYKTFKNKLKHTGINLDCINKRSMGNLACTILRLYVLFGKERARLWRYGRFQWCALGLNSRYFHPISRPCELFLFCWLSFSFSRFRLMFGVSLQTDHPMHGLIWNTN